ncbi:MAG: alpha/beta hydrolase [Ilumatobacteraceae bacterium]|jgi:pimeloyl-ACP methyl ester carboxylesterase|nr:alpha/beta hydrolase [Acidimicrobiaceae bacterium]MBP6487413.1 alpha/beta hydrolase [Ilumatobacteraceae bacterium]MBK9970568.1 alpha/beta hydrolase [Acidimicrobiaceae bacterium]MBP7888182.1 alpha/beta hydrolase [Ilumatobacteraceae bacterium]MBP8210127.1 alpha/beta hydrolase [Ilumatobacteraceae bacterium]
MLLAHELIGHAHDPAIVLIHGITDSRHAWHPLLHSLAAHHLVLAVDLRGHGESDSDVGYDPISYATDVVETASALGVNDALVVGHSLGGVVASAFAAIAPCRAVINIDQSLRLSAFKAALEQLEPMLKGDDESFQQALELMFTAMDGPLSASEQARLREHRRADQAVVLATWAAVFESTEAELDATVEALAGGITVPYLALHGIDPGPDYGPWLQHLVPTATVEVWPDMGHYLHLVDPARFLARLAEFEAQVGA